MKLNTSITIPQSEYNISHRDKILMIGSCFTQNIGNKLLDSKFDVNLNPFGVLYNPLSISESIKIILQNKRFEEKDIFLHNGIYNSLYHHSIFSDINPEVCLEKINTKLEEAVSYLKQINILFITFGTSYVYELKDSKKIVGNCHKLPADKFNRFRLDINHIVDEWSDIITILQQINPKLRVIFTVSPIRHIRDGLHDNQISKSILLIAIDEIQKRISNVNYFPSYEIVLDDLRDYRFYQEDMVHPSNIAINYIWEIFSKAYFTDKTADIIREWSKIQSSIDHRPLNKQGCMYKQFLKQTLLKLRSFSEKYKYICCEKEIEEITLKINKLENG